MRRRRCQVSRVPNSSKLLMSLDTISRRFTVTEYVDNLLASCAQSLFAWRTLQHHGLQANALQAIFQATVVAKLSYAWWGYVNAEDKARLEAFLHRFAKAWILCGKQRYLLRPLQASAPRWTTSFSGTLHPMNNISSTFSCLPLVLIIIASSIGQIIISLSYSTHLS